MIGEGERQRRVGIYVRVSSEDQALRGTIASQTDAIDHRLETEPDVIVVDRYVDDGVSGTIPLADRPEGSRLVRDIAAGLINEVWVYMVDRLGRDAVDLLMVRRQLDARGIKLLSIVEGTPDLLGYDVQAVVADHYRREFLRRTSDGMDTAAREGRYTGGIVAYGYRVEGSKRSARLIPDEEPLTAGLSAAGAVRWMYDRLAIDHWSCRRIADELNALGIPTSYARANRGVRRGGRKERTRGIWRTGRVRNLVTNPVYRGNLQYGRRSVKRGRELISGPVAPLVSSDIWTAAQATLAANRLIPKNTHRIYLLRGVLICGVCQMRHVGSQGRAGVWWYRCGGRRAERGRFDGGCPSRLVRGDQLERLIWADVERFLRDPGDVLAELDGREEREAADVIAAAQVITLSRRLDTIQVERVGFLRLAARGSMTDAALDDELARLDADRSEIDQRLVDLRAIRSKLPVTTAMTEILADLRSCLDAGLTDKQRQEIVALLVRATVHHDLAADGQARARVVVDYSFPGGLQTSTVTHTVRRCHTGLRPLLDTRTGRANTAGLPATDGPSTFGWSSILGRGEGRGRIR